MDFKTKIWHVGYFFSIRLNIKDSDKNLGKQVKTHFIAPFQYVVNFLYNSSQALKQ